MYSTNPPPSWEKCFKDADDELKLVSDILKNQGVFYPPADMIFNALALCPLDKVKVVIIGQDPYHGEGQAMGMAFSIKRNQKIPPSLQNIYKELKMEREVGIEKEYQRVLVHRDHIKATYKSDVWNGFEATQTQASLGLNHESIMSYIQSSDEQIRKLLLKQLPYFNPPSPGDLTSWAKQGVLLLNTCLTVAPGKPGSHGGMWRGVVARILEAIAQVNPKCVFLLWGDKAMGLTDRIGSHSIIISCSHPSPFSCNRATKDNPAFMGSMCFTKANESLTSPIDWWSI